MITGLALFIITSLLVATAIFLSLKERKSHVARTAVVLLFAMCLPLSYYVISELQGHAKPVSAELAKGRLLIHAVLLEEKKSIYLWVSKKSLFGDGPVALDIPWDEELLKQLLDAQKDAKDDNSDEVYFVLGDSDDDEDKNILAELAGRRFYHPKMAFPEHNDNTKPVAEAPIVLNQDPIMRPEDNSFAHPDHTSIPRSNQWFSIPPNPSMY